MVNYYRLTVFLSLVLSSVFVYGQEARVSGSFNGATFQKFVEDIESKTSYRFYFDPLSTDSLVVTASPQNQAIGQLLNQIFVGTDLKFSIDAEKNIYVTHEREILSTLPHDFFGTGEQQTGTPEAAFDYTLYEKREKERKLAETKLYSIGIKTSNLQGTASLAAMYGICKWIAGYWRSRIYRKPNDRCCH